MKAAVAFSLLLVVILAVPTAGLAVEAAGIRHWIPCFQCPPDIAQSVHVARSTGAAAIIIQVNIYDASGIILGSAIFPDAAGTFLARQIFFLTTDALTQTGLPSALYSAVLFNASNVTFVFYEQVGLNAQGVAGILTGRGDGYNYFTTGGGGVFALTLAPEGGTGLTNFFVCNNPANQMATFLGIPGPAAGAQAAALLITTAWDLVTNNFGTVSTFARLLSQISPAGVSGGSLFINPPGATRMACVKFLRIAGFGTVGGYTY